MKILTIDYAYDALSRVDTVSHTQDFDLSGSIGAGETRTTDYDYDAEGRRTHVSSAEGEIYYAYDDATGRLEHTWTGNASMGSSTTQVDYAYDDAGRLFTATTSRLYGTSVNLVATNFYDKVGNKVRETLPDGLTSTYAYDALNRLVEKENTVNGTSVGKYTYTLLADGNRSKVVEVTSEGTTTVNWSYDKLKRLTVEQYDSFDNGKDYTTTYAFDKAGNRKTRVTTGYQSGTTSYSYNNRDQLTSDGTSTYTYDLNGSTTSDGTHRSFYDARNLLVGYSANDDADVTDNGDAVYVSDHAGQRVHRKVEGTTDQVTVFHTDFNNPTGYSQTIEEKDASGTVTRAYLFNLALIGQADSATTPNVFATDGRGSTRQLITSTGSIGQRLDYKAYGELLTTPTSFDTYVGYVGQVFDPVMQQSFNRARYYNPSLGTFSSFDFSSPNNSKNPLSMHKFVYASQNPVYFWDPSGNSYTQILVGIGIVALLASLTVVTVPYFYSQPYALSTRNATGVGGPDITVELLHIRREIFRYSNSPLTANQLATFRNVALPGGWDIGELATQTIRTTGGAGTLSNGMNTVTVNRKVFYDPEVNYWIFGAWCRAAGTTEENMLAYIRIHRKNFAVTQGKPIWDYDDTAIGARQRWALAGYYGDLQIAAETAINGATPSSERSGSLTWYLGSPPFLSQP